MFLQDINAQAVGAKIRRFLCLREDRNLMAPTVVYLDGIIATKSIGSRDQPSQYDRFDVGRSRYSSSYQGSSCRYSQEYVITGRRPALQEPILEIWVHLMDLTSDDKHDMQLDPKYIPNPAVNDRLSTGFYVPITMNIAYGSDLVTSLTIS